MNELTHLQKQDFALNLLDNASKMPSGVVLVLTNAGFIPSWQYELREQARTSERWRFSSWDRPAPWLAEAEIAEARRRNPPNRFARLWGGQWVPASAGALDPADLERAVLLSGPTPAAEADFTYFVGVDLSVSRDTSAAATIGRHRHGRYKLVEVRAWTPTPGVKVDLVAVEDALLDMNRRWRKPLFAYDPFQAALMAQRLKRKGCRLMETPFVGKSMTAMASELVESFSSQRLALFRDEALLRDLRSMRIVEGPAGWKLSAPRTGSGHADRGTALALALLAAREGGPSRDFDMWLGPPDEAPPRRAPAGMIDMLWIEESFQHRKEAWRRIQ